MEWQRGAGDLGGAAELISSWKASGGDCMDLLEDELREAEDPEPLTTPSSSTVA